MLNIDYKSIKCPKCSRAHFEVLQPIENNCFAATPLVFKSTPNPVYQDGVLVNPQKPTQEQRFLCLECGGHFKVVRTYEINGVYSDAVVDSDGYLSRYIEKDDHLDKYLDRYVEEDAKARLKESIHHVPAVACGETDLSALAITSPIVAAAANDSDMISATLGVGTKSEIDLGGIKFRLNKVFTKEEAKHIEETFGWKVNNLEADRELS